MRVHFQQLEKHRLIQTASNSNNSFVNPNPCLIDTIPPESTMRRWLIIGLYRWSFGPDWPVPNRSSHAGRRQHSIERYVVPIPSETKQPVPYSTSLTFFNHPRYPINGIFRFRLVPDVAFCVLPEVIIKF